MAYTHEIIEREGYLQVTSAGKMDAYDGMLEYAKSILAALDSSGRKAVLLDHRSLNFKMFSLDAVDIAAWLDEQNIQSMGLRAAALPAKGDLLISKFFETVFVNRSLNLKVFSNEDAAVVWLRDRG